MFNFLKPHFLLNLCNFTYFAECHYYYYGLFYISYLVTFMCRLIIFMLYLLAAYELMSKYFLIAN